MKALIFAMVCVSSAAFAFGGKKSQQIQTCSPVMAYSKAVQSINLSEFETESLRMDTLSETEEAYFLTFTLVNPAQAKVKGVPYTAFAKVLKQGCYTTSMNQGSGKAQIFVPANAVRIQ